MTELIKRAVKQEKLDDTGRTPGSMTATAAAGSSAQLERVDAELKDIPPEASANQKPIADRYPLGNESSLPCTSGNYKPFPVQLVGLSEAKIQKYTGTKTMQETKLKHCTVSVRKLPITSRQSILLSSHTKRRPRLKNPMLTSPAVTRSKTCKSAHNVRQCCISGQPLSRHKPKSAKAHIQSEAPCTEKMEGKNISQMLSTRMLHGIHYLSDCA